jgi:dTDP-4-dehydrorhamnose 3,5-epimerase
MKFHPTPLPGVILVEPDVHRDARGYFLETWHADKYRAAGIDATFVQDNASRSARGTLRGLHYQEPDAQGKLVRVADGAVYDVAVDVRRGSPTFGRWYGVELSGENHRQLWIPPGFAHGFCVLSAHADFVYKCTTFYSPRSERAVRWDDPDIGVDWPRVDGIGEPLLSQKDRAAPRLADAAVLPDYRG